MGSRTYDLILIGATGFTGRRAAKYLHDHAPKNLKWGVAARNSDKLKSIARKLTISSEDCFIADTTQADSMEDLVEKTSVIISTVGPFSLYGEQLIAACAKRGTHYLDITGEVGFIKKMRDKYQDLALKSGAKLISFSGFDSVPADIACYLLAQKFNNPSKLDITAYYTISGGFNGGTIATMLNKFDSGEYKSMNDPALLLTNDESQKIHLPVKGKFFGFDTKINRWSTPFIMSAINSKVVYKSAAIMRDRNKKYADSISYSEHSFLGKWYQPFSFMGISLLLLSITVLGPYKWFRKFLRNIMPEPGEGPSEEKIENGFFKMTAFARDENNNNHQINISYPGDPGNKSTVFFLCESALLLVEKENKLPSGPGFLTPITAFEQLLVNRLSSKGLCIDHH